jgi:hypothetical protein
VQLANSRRDVEMIARTGGRAIPPQEYGREIGSFIASI